MLIPDHHKICIPDLPRAISKGQLVKNVLNENAVGFLARNIWLANKSFQVENFYEIATKDLESKSLMARAKHIANALFKTLPPNYSSAIKILIDSMPPSRGDSEKFGLSELFFLPYSFFISEYGLLTKHNDGVDPFETSMLAHRQLTMRFSAEFCIRPFIITDQERTFNVIRSWINDPSNHIRRLCSEGTRPRLPWGMRLKALVENPHPIIPILEQLKDDPSLYVRRSVANNLGDIAKDHPSLVFNLCEQWLEDADCNANIRWLVRHATRYYYKHGDKRAVNLRCKTKK